MLLKPRKCQRSVGIVSTASVAGIEAGLGPQLYSVATAGDNSLNKSLALKIGEYSGRAKHPISMDHALGRRAR